MPDAQYSAFSMKERVLPAVFLEVRHGGLRVGHGGQKQPVAAAARWTTADDELNLALSLCFPFCAHYLNVGGTTPTQLHCRTPERRISLQVRDGSATLLHRQLMALYDVLNAPSESERENST